MDVSGPTDWDQVRELIEVSYELIAPKKSLAKLVGGSSDLVKPKRKPARKARAKRR
jgi:predicted DNA-binding protein (MmcQ/YjbR family)